jgi:hypothetical protein
MHILQAVPGVLSNAEVRWPGPARCPGIERPLRNVEVGAHFLAREESISHAEAAPGGMRI